MQSSVPIMTEDTMQNTQLTEPSLTAGEAEMLIFALERSRAQFAWKCGGLDAAGLGRPLPPSTMTLGGLLKHLTVVEDKYTAFHLPGPLVAPPWFKDNGFDTDPEWDWHSAADDTPEQLYDLWTGAVERSRAAWAAAIADGGLDQPTKDTSHPDWRPNLRRMLVDLHDEYARHVGHADLLREAVDGLVGEDPPQHR